MHYLFSFFNVRRKSFCNKILQNQPKVRHLQLYICMYVYKYPLQLTMGAIPTMWLSFFLGGWGGGEGGGGGEFSWKPPTTSFDRMHMGGI